ncbi:chaperone protein dnaJ C76, chloroplastic [Elaeis guineensis]|uniref:Chaperone protein dnaJ C76, chloroplastic n=1 Tax=Elaeis guineensis var. tenera TaxID=51953 RepID=A0A6I9SBL4_ELAGV|nr:chaperone protein dnaJ C76, chloroplastic [Elaeis guineensis]
MPSLALYQASISPSAFRSSAKPPNSNAKIKTQFHPTNTKLRHHRRSLSCGCRASSSSSSWTSDFDLYEILGVESSSDQSQIKAAYRALQKRCHPDIAGPAGHDMAIVLNEIYSILSDPASRSAYDQEQAKVSEFRGYTGKPIYSTWFGSENEQRAVFVDEVRCVGCLKCALFASKTFAIESVYGRARAVAQWADPEEKILDAIQTCPVDCISIVERSNLAAFEYLMSKEPRSNVRMTAGNTLGVRVSNIFADVSKFQSKFHKMKDKASRKESKESDLQRESRISALHGVRSITNWWCRQSATNTSAWTETNLNLTVTNRRTAPPNTERLREAAAKCKVGATAGVGGQSSISYKHNEEYWTPILILPAPSSSSSTSSNMLKSEPPPSTLLEAEKEAKRASAIDRTKGSPLDLRASLAMAMISASVVGFRGGEMSGGGLKEHIGGSIALEIVNSFELQVLLAGVTWFVIGMISVGMVEALKNKGRG